MNQTDKGPEGNDEVCSTTEVQYAEKTYILHSQEQSMMALLL